MGHSLGVRTRAIKTLAPRTLTWEWICATPGRPPKGHSGVDDSTAAPIDTVTERLARGRALALPGDHIAALAAPELTDAIVALVRA